MEKIKPTTAYYIKLGEGGRFEKQCIEVDHTLRLGYNEIPHNLCTPVGWDAVLDIYIHQRGSDPGAAKRHVNQLQAFYGPGENILWVTFYNNKLWWCFAEKEIILQDDGSKRRLVKGYWRSTDIKDNPLTMDRLSGSLLSMQGFRGTICEVREFDYLVRKINAQQSPEEQKAMNASATLQQALVPIIKGLPWKDFELLTDLIFRQAGWQRVSELGKTRKDIDLDLMSPIANERYYVQVKSKASKSTFEAFLAATTDIDGYSRYYLVVHSPENLTKTLETETHKLWLETDIAHLVVSYGLVEWVIGKAR